MSYNNQKITATSYHDWERSFNFRKFKIFHGPCVGGTFPVKTYFKVNSLVFSVAWQPRQVLDNITKYCFLSNSANKLFMQWKNKILHFTYLKQSTAVILNLRNSLLNFPTVGHIKLHPPISSFYRICLFLWGTNFTQGRYLTTILSANVHYFFHQVITGRARLIRSHSSARFCFELSGNSN